MTENYEQYLDWVIYQIYPKSFLDTNGDGVGDIQGVIQKLDYIKSLGVNAIWLCPIYESPQQDNGYDISNYYTLQKEYGSTLDFEELTKKAHALGIKIIMDLVANHTSNEHPWFQEAKSKKKHPYHQYYYFAKQPLNDWQSIVGGSAWAYNEGTKEYYLHSFAPAQPDLNWNNPKVRKEFCDIIDFWVEKGADGFRCDMLDFIAKDFDKNLMFGGKRLYSYVGQLFGRKKTQNLFTVGECQADEQSIHLLCGEGKKQLKCAFQFEHLHLGRKDKFTPTPSNLKQLKNILKKWQTFSQEKGFLYTLLTDNHDQPWYNSRMGNDTNLRYESATLLATMVYALRGVPFIYQGQEIGSANSVYPSIENFDDVETLHYFQANQNKYSKKTLMQKINYGSRDNPRRPMAWDKGVGFGFTSAKKPWLAFATRSKEINVKSEEKKDKSILRYYRDLFKLRKEKVALRRGTFEDKSVDENSFIFERTFDQEKLVIVCNFEKQNRINGLNENVVCLLSNYPQKNLPVNRLYQPYEAVIYHKKSDKI